MITWTKGGKIETPEGRIISYYGLGTRLTIESRKRAIPHANGIGTWDYTSYVLLSGFGHVVKEFNSLKDAKEYAETHKEEIS